ncbi:MAG: LuxR C-terminal-related transcriptional regulator [Bacteroidota bacterium]
MTMTPQYIQRVVALKPDNNRLELVVQVSNFHHRRGGIWRPIRLGFYERIKRDNDLEKAFGLFVMASFILMAFYNLNLYFYLKKDLAPLMLSIFFAIGALRSLLVGQLFYTWIFPDFDWELAMKLEYFTFYLCGPVFYRMLRCLYPAEVPSWFIRVISWAAYLFTGVTILTPARVYSPLAPIFQAILLSSVIYMLAVLARISVKRKEYLILGVFTIIFLSLFNDVLFYNNLLRAEFPTIPIIEGFLDLPFLSRHIPTGFISMVFFILIFNLLTLKMTQYYFTRSGFIAKPELAAAVIEEHDLTPREAELVRYIIQGYSNKEIAAAFSISEGTVKTHLHRIFQKTGARNRTELSHLLKK